MIHLCQTCFLNEKCFTISHFGLIGLVGFILTPERSFNIWQRQNWWLHLIFEMMSKHDRWVQYGQVKQYFLSPLHCPFLWKWNSLIPSGQLDIYSTHGYNNAQWTSQQLPFLIPFDLFMTDSTNSSCIVDITRAATTYLFISHVTIWQYDDISYE